MQILHSLDNPKKQPLALTIGNFDGVHLGHQAIVKALVAEAKTQQLCPAAMTFSPHAKTLFGDCHNYLISSDTDKAEQLHRDGVDILYQIPFNRDFSQITAEQFIDKLIHQLHVKYLLVGDDFRFGHRGQGDFQLLTEKARPHGIIVNNTPTVSFAGSRISSSRIRDAIQSADFDLTKQLLGRPLSYRGIVVADKQLGRTINFPTANLRFDETRLLPAGVFAVHVGIEGQTHVYHGMCNIGTKPTLENGKIRQIETHIFDFCEDLYGKQLTVTPIAKIRDEQKFDNVTELVAQLHRDKVSALEWL